MTHSRARRALIALVFVAAVLFGGMRVVDAARHPRPAVNPATAVSPAQPATNPLKKKAMRPNIDVYVYRRCYAPTEKIELNVSVFNVKSVSLAAYPFDLSGEVSSPEDMGDFKPTINRVDTSGRKAAATWNYKAGKTYPDQWQEFAVPVPRLAPGVYLIVASSGVIQKRTWLAVTGAALIGKRSLELVQAYAVDVVSGKPLAGIALRTVDSEGSRNSGVTGSDGVLRIPVGSDSAGTWIYGETPVGPVFGIVGRPGRPDPFTVFCVDDRPVYRPGNLVQYTATIRQRFEAVAPGGFAYKPFTGDVTVEIHDCTDALISRNTVRASAAGSLSGRFQLAPEAATGNWNIDFIIGDHTYYNSFTVESYRKPEMIVTAAFAKAHYLGGSTVPLTIDAQYYFGRPVVGAVTQYSVTFTGDNAPSNYQAKGITGSDGKLTIQIPTAHGTADETLQVSGTVTDLSRHSQTVNAQTTITSGLFQLSLSPNSDTYLPGKRITITATATDYDNKPVATAVRVTMTETKEDDQQRVYKEVTIRDIHTDSKGSGIAEFSCPRPADLSFDAVAFDFADDKIEAGCTAEVVARREELEQPAAPAPLTATADKDRYNPGDTALIAVDCPLVGTPAAKATKTEAARPAHPDAWALVSVEGERLGLYKVVHLTRRDSVVRIPLTDADFPSVTVDVAVVQDHELYEQEVPLDVRREEQKLSVSVTSDKSVYQPGDTATYTITTKDWLGRPAPAEVSLGVVDASIYAIQADKTPDIESVFYGSRQVRVETDFSFAAQYSGGGYQNVPSQPQPASPKSPGIRVRKNFADTAYWSPAIETDASGTAQVSFTVPDNLTTWRATAHAITTDTAVGGATHDAIGVMPLLVRLELPRFLVAGDKSVVSAIVQNGTKEAKTVRTHIDVSGATLSGDPDGAIQLDPGGQQRLDWPVTTATGSNAVFTVTADGGPGARDAAQQEIPVLADGDEMVTARADTLTDAAPRETVDVSSLPAGSSLTITLSPSIASSALDALDGMTDSVGGDAESVVSALLPDIVAAGALHSLGVDRPIARGHLDDYVSVALQKLYLYQHRDGGWNWWEFDQTDPEMTAYVLGALVQTKNAGYTVDDSRIARGASALKAGLAQEQDLSRRAEYLMTLSYADPNSAKDALAGLADERDQLTTYAKASVAIGLAQYSDADIQAKALAVARDLEGEAIVEGRAASWRLQPGGCLWSGDDVTLTAHVLRALLAADPTGASDLESGAAQWLMAARNGQSWDTARAGCEAVLALSAYMARTGELKGNFTAEIDLDGKSVDTLAVTPQTMYDAPQSITLTPDRLRGISKIEIAKGSGGGALYVSRVLRYAVPSSAALPQVHGITVKKTFGITVDDPSKAQTIASGSPLDVDLEIDCDTDYRYVSVSDPIPAGCDVVDESDSIGDAGYPTGYSDGAPGYGRIDIRDDRVLFYFDSLPRGRTSIRYQIIAEQPGEYRILPTVSALTYFPEVRGTSAPVGVSIGEAK
jgi:hypothetical protein